MTLTKFPILFFLFLGIATHFTHAFNIKKLGVEDGLSNNNVVSMAQDRDGFIWICTKDGLNRFDTNSFKVFKKSETDKNSISSNVLNCVFADKEDDVVWISTEKNGIDAYNYKTDKFTHYEHDYSGSGKNSLIANGVTHITNDSKNNLWLATYQSGIDYFDKKTKQFTHYNQSNIKGLGSDYNWVVMTDTDDQIYVGHVSDGFSIVNIKTMQAVNFKHDPSNPNSLPDNTVTSIFKDSKKHIWIGTRNGLTLFDPTTHKMTNFKNSPCNPKSISFNFIKSIIETENGKLWIGTEGGGINILDLNSITNDISPQNITFVHIDAANTPDGLSSSSVQCILQDTFGNIWLGGYVGGINFIDRRVSFFNKITYLPFIGNTNSLNNKLVTNMCVEKNENIWVANGTGGICIYNKGKKLKQITSISNSTEPLNIMASYKDSEGNIWFGSADGHIYKYNGNTEKFETIESGLNNMPIYNFFEDSNHNLWFSTDIGLHKYNPKNREIKNYSTANSAISDNVIRAISEDKDGNLWIGTLMGGLRVFDSKFNLLYNYGRYYDFYNINQIYRDSENNMWVASQNDLFRFKNTNNASVTRIGKKQGFRENDIRSIVEGKSANDIWVSTTTGISHLDLTTMHISNFSISDNIVMGDYLNGSLAKTTDGTIYFGSQNGISYFNQQMQEVEVTIPQTVISSFSINDVENKKLNELIEIPFDKKMDLRYNQNSFRINFNVLDYSLSDKVEYMYQMDGLDEKWYLIHKDQQVTFRNLNPGKYAFNLKTRLHNKEWGTISSSMQIEIHPIIWLSRWAKACYLIIILLLINITIRFYKNKIKIENALLFEKKNRLQEQQVNEEKLKFFTNITHELRSPLTLILGPLEDLISDKSLQHDQARKIASTHRVANRLLQLINQILEFRKSENNNRKLQIIKDDLSRHVYEIGLKYKELHQNKSIKFEIKLPEDAIDLYFDPEVISIILDNLLSNAFKYTQKGTISLELNNYTEHLIDYTEILISDTGFGISENDLPHIFERFYQAKNTTYPISGTGIGLALVKNMSELHEAEISVNSQLNKGTQFSLKFLTNNTYPNGIHVDIPDAQTELNDLSDDEKDLILVVDDNPEIIEYINDCLTDSYQIITAENGKIAYEIACEKVPDIVISDIMMPVMDGIEMCEEMKKDVRTCHIPIILLTAKGSIQDKSIGYDAGADSYITKPFSGNLLRSRLRNIMDTRKKLSTTLTTTLKDKQHFFNESTNQLDKEFLEKLTDFVENNLEDEEMNISLISAHLNMSHSTLYRKIKALTNLTANEFIRKIRMQVAEQLLLSNKYSISEIMYKVGMNSIGYFRRCFKDEFGMAPRDYVQQLKDKQA